MLPLTESPDERFAPGASLRRADAPALVVRALRHHGQRTMLRFEGVGDRNAAEGLRGTMLFVSPSELLALPEGRWWAHDLEGCEVVTDTGRALGRLTEVVDNPANDIWVAHDGNREWLLPVLDDTILDVDLDARRITVADIPGLTTDEE